MRSDGLRIEPRRLTMASVKVSADFLLKPTTMNRQILYLL
jgi:hypothetical protein